MKLNLKKFKKNKQSKESNIENSLPTNDTLEDHRRQILKIGKKHSRPLSDTQQKIVIVSTFLTITTLCLTVWLYTNAVYSKVDTSNLVHSVAKIIPTPVISVNDTTVMYDQLLFQYNTAVNVAENEDRLFDQDLALSSAASKVIEAKIVDQIATEQDVTVSDQDIENGIAEPVLLAGGDETFDSTILEIYGWSRGDFKREFKLQLLKSRIVTNELFQFSKQVNYDNFTTSANNLGLNTIVVDGSSTDSANNDIAAIVQNLNSSSDNVSPIVYGESGVYIVKKSTDEKYEYVSQTYEEIEAFIQRRINQADISTCLNKDKITIKNAVKISILNCVRS